MTAQNNQAYRDFAEDELAARYENNRLPNASRLDVEVADLEVTANSVDVTLMVLSYHDIYYTPADGSWPTIDGPKLLSVLHSSLKPGGVLGVVDHVAEAGSPVDKTANDLHRIDPGVIRKEITAAGFTLEAETDLLRNDGDDRRLPMYAESIRGKTDRIVMRFRKPVVD